MLAETLKLRSSAKDCHRFSAATFHMLATSISASGHLRVDARFVRPAPLSSKSLSVSILESSFRYCDAGDGRKATKNQLSGWKTRVQALALEEMHDEAILSLVSCPIG